MTLTAQNLIDRAAAVLNDASFTRWTANELLGWCNDGRRDIARLRPEVYSTTATVASVIGAKQSIPETGTQFLSVIRQTGRGVVTPTTKVALDAFCRGWVYGFYDTTPVHYMPHDTDPRAFWIYPPLRQGVSLEVAYVPTLTDLALAGTLTAREEPLASALVDYICYRAISKDVEFGGNAARAAAHYAAFNTAVGGGGTA